jgi:hypothetical protein
MNATAENTRAEPASALAGKIAFTQTISRELAHKRRLENVYITSVSSLGEGQFLCGAFMPMANMYLNEMRAGPGDVALTMIEIGRQAGIAICHQHLGVPRSHVFVLDKVSFTATAAFADVDWTVHSMVTIRSKAHNEVAVADEERVMLWGNSEFSVNGVCIGSLSVSGVIQSAERYQRLRKLIQVRRQRIINAARAEARADETRSGLWLQSSLPAKRPVIGELLWMNGDGAFTAGLNVDRSNQFFFDHENDHVPGMLILEGLRELASDVALRFRPPIRRDQYRVPIGEINVSFKSFAELDRPVDLVAEVRHRTMDRTQPVSINLIARQGNEVVAHASAILDYTASASARSAT